MIHRYHGSKEGVRRALKRSLFRALVLEGKVETTLPRARQLQYFAEYLVNMGKPSDVNARRRVFAEIGQDKKVLENFFGTILSATGDRQSGYTRIVKLGQRVGDGSMVADVEWVDGEKMKKGDRVIGESGNQVEEKTEREVKDKKKVVKKESK